MDNPCKNCISLAICKASQNHGALVVGCEILHSYIYTMYDGESPHQKSYGIKNRYKQVLNFYGYNGENNK